MIATTVAPTLRQYGRELTALAGGLSQRYREQSGTGRSLLHGEAEAVAYACARMPATYAAVRTALGWALPGSGAYATMLDVGAGTGAAGWAAALELDGLCAAQRVQYPCDQGCACIVQGGGNQEYFPDALGR